VAKPTPEPTQGPLRFPRSSFQVGDVRYEHWVEEIEERSGASVTAQRSEHRRHVTVLATDGGQVTKVRVSYELHTVSLTVDGVSRERGPSLTGQTYFLQRVAGGETNVLKESGPVTQEEARAVVEDNGNFSKPNRFLEVMTNRAWTIGEQVDLDSGSVFNNERINGNTVVRLTGYDDKVARFEMHIVSKVDTLDVDMTIKLEVDRHEPKYSVQTVTGTGSEPGLRTRTKGSTVVARAR
jgi:hypothetical protein